MPFTVIAKFGCLGQNGINTAFDMFSESLFALNQFISIVSYCELKISVFWLLINVVSSANKIRCPRVGNS